MDVTDSVWLVTGASRGIGKAIARFVLENGGKVIGTVRNHSHVEDLVEGFPDSFKPIVMDLNDESQIDAGAELSMSAFGRVDVLVNNAGYGLHGMIEEVGMEQVRQQMETNFFGLVSLTQKILPHMRSNGFGWVVNVASVAGLKGTPSLGIYNASKFAVVGLTEALAEEVKDFGVFATVVEPGPYRTDWAGSSMKRADALQSLSPESPYYQMNNQWKKFFEERDGKQPGDPDQIAKVLWDAFAKKTFPVHMLFGDVAISLWKDKLARLSDPSFMRHYPHELETV